MSRQTSFRADQVHQSVFVAAGAVIVGDVSIGEDSSVWFNAVIRGDTTSIRVGRRCNIQDGTILHADPGFPCTLGDGVTVGHAAVIHGATVGENTMIGMKAVVMNGAEIGANSIVGVGAVVTEGTRVPEGTLVVGIPGRVRRPLSDVEIERNRLAADHYVEAGRDYRAGESSNASASQPRPYNATGEAES